MKVSKPTQPKKVKLPRKTVVQMTTIHLPGENYAWKVLDALSSDLCQFLNAEEQWLLDFITRNRDIESYLALSEMWGLQCSTSEGVSLAERRAKLQLAALLKKFKFSTDEEKRKDTAKQKFYAAEESCSNFNQEGYKLLLDDVGRPLPETWAMRSFLRDLLGVDTPNWREIVEGMRHGPGANLDTQYGQVSIYNKYTNWPYSCTRGTERFARFFIGTDQRWMQALTCSYRERFNIPQESSIYMRKFWTDVIKIVPGNRICFVPKDARTERTIAIEPAINLMIQLGIDQVIRTRLKRFGVDLDDQTKNQELARLGSMSDDEDSFVTVDLSAASDSISLKLCELLLPKYWYDLLCDLRSPSGNLGKQEIVYSKISSMGNGYTFALESSLFTAMIYAAIRTTGNTVRQRDFAVYGDDLIVRKRFLPTLLEILAKCGFKINKEKSFTSGPIRESCGTDWFDGKPLRPVFITDVPKNTPELLNDYNRLKRILELRWGIDESKALKLIFKWIPPLSKEIVGPLSDEDFASYIHRSTPCSLHARHRRWVWEYKRFVFQPLRFKGHEFNFRKLMHDLRGAPLPGNWVQELLQEAGSGSRFTVTRREAVTLGLAYSVAEIWQSEYNEYTPPRRAVIGKANG
jgi:hypothetical protein